MGGGMGGGMSGGMGGGMSGGMGQMMGGNMHGLGPGPMGMSSGMNGRMGPGGGMGMMGHVGQLGGMGMVNGMAAGHADPSAYMVNTYGGAMMYQGADGKFGYFPNQQKTVFSEPFPNEEESAYIRKPVNPHRHARPKRIRPSDFKALGEQQAYE